MADESARIETFAYQAQTPQGQTLSGTIDAGDVDAASLKLQSLQLRITGLEPTRKLSARATLRGADFLAFNQQLAQLTAGGLPVERSLRLLATEMHGTAARAVNDIAEELEKGTPLDAAFTKHGSGFPPLYGALVKAGIQSNNLPGMLLNLGRHVEMMQRLRGAIWRAATYPLSVLAALLVVLAFVWTCVIPKFAPLLAMPQMPAYSWSGPVPSPPSFDWLISVASTLNLVLMLLIAFVLFSVLVLAIVARLPAGRSLVEPIVMPLPLIGPILRWNLLARWCDALRLGVEAGLDLPAALLLAHRAIDSPRLQADGKILMDAVAAGKPIDSGTTQLLPPLVPAALQLGIEQNDLAATTNMLAKMYQEQAEIRLSVLPQVLSPLLLILTATSVGLAVLVVVLPLAAVLRWLSH